MRTKVQHRIWNEFFARDAKVKSVPFDNPVKFATSALLRSRDLQGYYESNTTDNNPKICPVVLKGIKGLTIEGNGSEFVCHGRMQPLTLEDCEGVTIRNLNIYALSVDGLRFKDNTIKHNTEYKPWQGRKAMLTFRSMQGRADQRKPHRSRCAGKEYQHRENET